MTTTIKTDFAGNAGNKIENSIQTRQDSFIRRKILWECLAIKLTMKVKTRALHTCKRCGWIWINRTPNPKACPKCTSYLWHTPPDRRKKRFRSENYPEIKNKDKKKEE